MSRSAEPGERIVVLGKFGAAVGLQGWIKIQSFTDPPENILAYRTWQIGKAGEWRPMKVAEGRGNGTVVQARIESCQGRAAAEQLRNLEIGVFRRELPDPAPGQYYLDDLLGLEALTPAGEVLGRLDHYLEMPAHPVMVIKGKQQHLVPMVKERILSVDFAKGSMTVDWGLDW
jgi:16S rRNA processing protein RimM